MWENLNNNIIYIYDGSLIGFYCCVYESVYLREMPMEIYGEGENQPSLFFEKQIESDAGKAKRVRDSIPEKMSARALELVECVYLSCLENKELAMLKFLRLGYREGRKITEMLGNKIVSPMVNAERHLLGEAHLLKGFVRFSDYDGFLAARISPKNFVLPFIAEHFCMRYPEENFLIFDKINKAALIHENGQAKIIPLENIEFPEADENELRYRALWKHFYNTVAIEARTNPRCRMTHMPKRYWENMLEVQDLLNK